MGDFFELHGKNFGTTRLKLASAPKAVNASESPQRALEPSEDKHNTADFKKPNPPMLETLDKGRSGQHAGRNKQTLPIHVEICLGHGTPQLF